MRRAVIALAVAGTLAGGGAALASGPGPNGNNTYGLCTAYGSGSQNGQNHKQQAPPFQALQQAAANANESVAQYCASATPGGK